MKRHYVVTALMSMGVMLVAVGLALFGFSGVETTFAETNQQNFEDDSCLACHTDQSRLSELAKVEDKESESSLSSGPG